MITYLLLRSNKESGPYSLNELLQFGLKPYDLVWVNGKSAAWRYPGEIDELKEFAPMVEEQPFDRFYKKQADNKPEESYQPKIETPTPTPVPPQTFTPKKSVFVTMPGQKTAANQQEVIKQPQPVPQRQEPIKETPTISITENPVAAEIKYSQPLDEIKEMYVKTLQERKQKIANKAFLMQLLKKAAVVLAIVGAGVLIGFMIKSEKGTKELLANTHLTNSPQTTSALTQEVPESNDPAEQVQPEEKNDINPVPLSSEKTTSEPLFIEPAQPVIQKPVQEKETMITPKKEIIIEKKEPPVDQPSPGVDIDSRTGERSKKQRVNESLEDISTGNERSAGNPEPKAVMKSSNELSKQVSIKSNDYQVVAFGGIRNLQLTVYNDSKWMLDNVTVELQYLKPSEQPLRTETIHFRSVAPNGSMTVRVPDTNRGIKVLYKITNILSTQSSKETAGL